MSPSTVLRIFLCLSAAVAVCHLCAPWFFSGACSIVAAWLLHDPTGPFTISETRDQEIGVFYVVQERILKL